MKRFATVTDLIAAYTEDFNSRCTSEQKQFTAAEIKTNFLTTMLRQSLWIKYDVRITAKQAHTIRGFGYVEM